MFTIDTAKSIWEKIFKNSISELPLKALKQKITWDLTNSQPTETIEAKLKDIFRRAEQEFPKDTDLEQIKATLLVALSHMTEEDYKFTWGGPRPGAGRPKTGAMPNKTIRMTDQEYIKVKEYLKTLRASK